MKNLKWNLVLISFFYLALGAFLTIRPDTALKVVCYALGGVVLLCAVVQLVKYFRSEKGVFRSTLTLLFGIVCLALGGFMIVFSGTVVRILPIVFGLFVIFDSLGRIQSALELRKCGYPSWKTFILLAILSIVLGVIMFVNPFGTMETLVMAIGIILLIEGVLNLLSAGYTGIAVHHFRRMNPARESELEEITGLDLDGDGVIAPPVAKTDAVGTAVELDTVDESADAFGESAAEDSRSEETQPEKTEYRQ